MTSQRLLATSVWLLTAGIVVSVEVVLARVLVGDESPWWHFIVASAVVALLTAGYMRWLAPRMHRDDRPRWRLTPGEAAPLLPYTLGVSLVSAGVASSTYWPDWVGAAIGALALTALSWYGLERWEERRRPSSLTA
ncbi:hypothetical protein [Blastococcus deserti]|uniref:Uncharacterized protein n=1 Tax=Blastococcus deserti TaxID=2259033 RepID=A0ABW4X9L4_9ACTN